MPVYAGFFIAVLIPVVFVFVLIRAPEKLQSEGHQIQLKALDIVQEQSRRNNLKRTCLEEAFEKVFAPYQRPGPEVPATDNHQKTGPR